MKGLSGLFHCLREKNLHLTSSESHAKLLFFLPSNGRLSCEYTAKYFLLHRSYECTNRVGGRRAGHREVSARSTSSLDICFQPLEIISPFPRRFSITGFVSHQRQQQLFLLERLCAKSEKYFAAQRLLLQWGFPASTEPLAAGRSSPT